MDATKRIGVLLGGITAERDASLRAGEAIITALRDKGHDAQPVFVDRDADLALRQAKIEVAFLALRGRYGADGCIQGLLEVLGVPYTGSGVLASSLAMNRARTKDVLRLHNLPTAPAYVLREGTETRLLDQHGAFGFPVLVRPVSATTSLGTVAHDEMELEAAVEDAFRSDEEVLVERLIEGRLVSVGVLDGHALGAVELPRPDKLPTLRLVGGQKEAARISGPRYKSLLRLATQAYESLGCEGAASVDLIVNERLNEVVVDVDTAPLLTPTSTMGRVALASGMKFADLIDEVLHGARLRAHGHRRNRRSSQVAFPGPDRRPTASSVAH